MLFDLRSPHRRRVIKVVYVFLAVLIGGGLIFFGIGNGSNFGGLLTAAGGSGSGSSSTSGQALYTKALAKAEKLAKASPHDAAVWVKAGEAAYAVATLPNNYSSTVGFTPAGHVALNKLRQAWQNYLSDAPANPNGYFAGEVVAGFNTPPAGVGDYKTAESAQEVVAAAQPTDVQYEYLAYYSWLARDTTTGNLAAARARSLAPKKDLKTINSTLSEMLAVADAQTGATSATGATGASGASGATGATSG
jgi:hypothetical protein